MTKISNTGNNIWNLLEQAAASKGEDRKQIRDVVPELKERQIKTDSLELSREVIRWMTSFPSGWRHTPDNMMPCKNRMRMAVGIFTYLTALMKMENCNIIKYRRRKMSHF